MKQVDTTIGALYVFEMSPTDETYGKAGASNTIDVAATLLSATITAGATIKGSDVIYIYPFLVSSAMTPASGDIVIKTKYYQTRRGFKETDVTVAILVTDSVADVVTKINAQFATDGVDSYFVADGVVTTGTPTKVRIQSKDVNANFSITSDVTTAFTAGDAGQYLQLKVAKDVASIDTTVTTSVFYNQTSGLVAGDLEVLEYEVIRSIGETTGSTLNSSLTPEDYKGNAPIAIQTEYATGEASLTVDDLSYNYENLDRLKGFTKTTSAAFFSGKTAASYEKYTFGSLNKPNKFRLLGLHPKADGDGLLQIHANKCISPSSNILMAKSFRTSSETFTILSEADKNLIKIISI